MSTELGEVFTAAGCDGTLLVRCLDDARSVGCGHEELVVLASTVKVLVALEAEAAFSARRLDATDQVVIDAPERVAGPVGLSLFRDQATMSLRDLVVLMLTISDNAATDVLMNRIGLAAVNARARSLGLHSTVVVSDIRGQIDSIAQDLGYPSWEALTSADIAPGEAARLDERLPATSALTPSTATRSTAADMVQLLAAIWDDRAGPPEACARVRHLMAQQLTRHRLASGFAAGVKVAAKSGGLAGMVRNEVGVITYPDGSRYAAAVFTRTRPGADARPVDAAIGRGARIAIDQLRGETGSELSTIAEWPWIAHETAPAEHASSLRHSALAGI